MNDIATVVIIALLVIDLVGLLMIGIRVNGQKNDNRKLNSDTRKIDQRVTLLEVRFDHQPKHRDLTALSDSINKMAETVATIKGQTQTMTQMLSTVQEHLLENDR